MSQPFYRAFEDRYRGARDTIKQRLRAYAPFIAPLAQQQQRPAALDLGCGRGEWLELLGESGYEACGVDLDDAMLAACRERGLKVETADALAALRARPDASLALVSAFHLIEHIPFELVQELIASALRVLQPGGLLILETPNPENLVVGASSFYLDPSHLRPVPPLLLAFAAEHAGYARHKIVRLQEEPQLHTDAALGLINVLEGPSPDYSVVAQKAGPAALMAACDAAFAADYGFALAPLAVRYQEQLARENGELHRALGRLGQQQAEQHAALAQRAGALEQLLNDQAGQARQLSRQLAEELAQLQLQQQQQQLQQQQGQADAMQRLAQLEQRVHQAEVHAEAMSQRVLDLLSSTSWRITAPLRRAVTLARRVRGGARSRLRAAVLRSGQAVLRRPRLKRVVRALLRLTPRLQARLFRAMLHAAATVPAALHQSDAPGQLSPRAARAYHELKQAAQRAAAKE
jgi:SAM-dependent methyltransferase